MAEWNDAIQCAARLVGSGKDTLRKSRGRAAAIPDECGGAR